MDFLRLDVDIWQHIPIRIYIDAGELVAFYEIMGFHLSPRFLPIPHIFHDTFSFSTGMLF